METHKHSLCILAHVHSYTFYFAYYANAHCVLTLLCGLVTLYVHGSPSPCGGRAEELQECWWRWGQGGVPDPDTVSASGPVYVRVDTCVCGEGGGGRKAMLGSAAPVHNIHWSSTRAVHPVAFLASSAPGTLPPAAAPPRLGHRKAPLVLESERKPSRCPSRPHQQLKATHTQARLQV